MTSLGYSHSHRNVRALAYGLGWFSIALGLGELVAPRQIKTAIGAPTPAAVFSAYGIREILTGLAILGSREPNRMVWGRVAGDVLDLATLAPTLSPQNPHRTEAIGAVAFVGGALALDVLCASMDGSPSRASEPAFRA